METLVGVEVMEIKRHSEPARGYSKQQRLERSIRDEAVTCGIATPADRRDGHQDHNGKEATERHER